ncbi:MAG: YbhN family protein [Paracoccaceae bacterium]
MRSRTTLIIFGIFLAFTALALWAASGEDIWQQIGRLTIGELSILLALSLANYFLRALRWMIFTRAIGLRSSALQIIRHYIGGFALTMTPARLGEAVRMRWIAREAGARIETVAPLILVDRAGDLASTGLLLAVSLTFGATGIAGGLPAAIIAVIAAMIATRPVLFRALIDTAFCLIRRKARLFVRARRAARELAPFSSPLIAMPALLLGGIGWLAEGCAFYLLLTWMGADVGFWTAVSIFLFSMMSGGVTGMPGGVGGAEAAMLALLAINGVGLEIALPATAIIRITTLWFAIGLGIVIFPFAETLAARSRHALEKD